MGWTVTLSITTIMTTTTRKKVAIVLEWCWWWHWWRWRWRGHWWRWHWWRWRWRWQWWTRCCVVRGSWSLVRTEHEERSDEDHVHDWYVISISFSEGWWWQQQQHTTTVPFVLRVDGVNGRCGRYSEDVRICTSQRYVDHYQHHHHHHQPYGSVKRRITWNMLKRER
jgi:hypothetical protein